MKIRKIITLVAAMALLMGIATGESSAKGNEWRITENDPIYETLRPFIPVDAISVTGYEYEMEDRSLVAIVYSVYTAVETGIEEFTPGLVVGQVSHSLIVGYRYGDTYQHLFDMPTPTDWETPWLFTRVEFAGLSDGYEDKVVLVTMGYELSEVFNLRLYEISAYEISTVFAGYTELSWNPWPEFADENEADFEISEGDNGIIVWTKDMDSYQSGPAQVTQILYVLDEYTPGMLTEEFRETTDESYDQLPSEPPVNW